jgi:protein-S-isoprenylcysteine O-methyltransferase Ste14
MITRAVRFVVSTIVFFGLLFLTAGTVRWPAAWAYAALVSATLLAYTAILLRLHPDLIDERTKPPADAKKWDKPFVFVLGGVGTFGQLLVCGFDHRFSWSPPMPGWLIITGLLLMAAGGILTNWAVASNRFFSAFVRIQRDRGHRVVDSGPYSVVRHPGYVGSILHMFGTGLALSSWWAVGIAALLTLGTVWRIVLEDRTLQAELEGYSAYAGRVRFRLLSGIW